MTSDFALKSCLHRAIAAAAIAAVSALAAGPARAADDDLIVKYDQSQLLRLTRPAAEIIIGNPSIADVSVQSGNLLVITGKTFGVTNIITLDADRNVIQDQRVLVKRDEGKVVNLQRGTDRQSYNCTPQCNPSITIGDERQVLRCDPKCVAEQERVLRKAEATRARSRASTATSSPARQSARARRAARPASERGGPVHVLASRKFTNTPTGRARFTPRSALGLHSTAFPGSSA